MKKTNIKLSPRTKMRLTAEELEQLNEYITSEPAAFKNINQNTGIDSRTVNLTAKRGWLELAKGVKLRDFLLQIKLLTA